MLASFPPFPSPNPATMKHSPLDNALMMPSPPHSSSSASSEASSPLPSTPPTPSSPTSSVRSLNRSRSRSAARKSASHTRIKKQPGQSSSSDTPDVDSRPGSTLRSPPITPPSGSDRLSEKHMAPDTAEKLTQSEILEEKPRQNHHKSSLRSHHYEDAVRIACGAWGETGSPSKKKTVTFDKEISA